MFGFGLTGLGLLKSRLRSIRLGLFRDLGVFSLG